MKKKISLGYYVLFVGGLWVLNRQFQYFVAVNGILNGLLVGLLLAFLAKLVFKTVTKMLLAIIVIIGIVVFLFSIGYFTLPEWVYDLWAMVPLIRNFIGD